MPTEIVFNKGLRADDKIKFLKSNLDFKKFKKFSKNIDSFPQNF